MSSILYITQIHIEPGALQRLAEECQKHLISRPLIVTDAGIKAAGLLQKTLNALPGMTCTVFDGTPSNPTEAAVRAGADAKQVRITAVIEVPMSYLPGQGCRVQVKAAGPLAS